eukprot:1614631-Pleurochrysis_carterae.AAC.1
MPGQFWPTAFQNLDEWRLVIPAYPRSMRTACRHNAVRLARAQRSVFPRACASPPDLAIAWIPDCTCRPCCCLSLER